MTTDIKKQLKLFKKSVKEFQSVSKTDYVKGIEGAKELIKKANGFMKYKEVKEDSKKVEEISKVKEALQLYITNVTNIQKFGKKWDKSK